MLVRQSHVSLSQHNDTVQELTHARLLGCTFENQRPGRVQEIYRPVPAIIAKFGGKVLARCGRFQIMEGPAKFTRFIVIEFPTLEQGAACFTSLEYDRAEIGRAHV